MRLVRSELPVAEMVEEQVEKLVIRLRFVQPSDDLRAGLTPVHLAYL